MKGTTADRAAGDTNNWSPESCPISLQHRVYISGRERDSPSPHSAGAGRIQQLLEATLPLKKILP